MVIGPTHGSSATSGDMEAWSKSFDIYGGQCAGAATNTLIDWVRPGGVTKLYTDLADAEIWMMVHMSKRHAPFAILLLMLQTSPQCLVRELCHHCWCYFYMGLLHM